MKTNAINEGLKYGAICGLAAILIMYGSWAGGITFFTGAVFYSTFIPYMVAIIVIGGLQLRKQSGGFLNYKEALKFSFLSYAVAAVIVAIGTYILYNIIDPTLTEQSARIALEKTRQMMEKFGASEADIEKSLKESEKSMKETGLKQILIGTGWGLIWDFAKSLLISLIIRKEQKPEDQLA
jgi:uncharacterized membrane protein YccC